MTNYTDKQKATAVRRVTQQDWTYEAAGEKIGASVETVCYWVARKEGFKNTKDWRTAKGKTRSNGKNNGRVPPNGTLPVIGLTLTKRTPKPKALIPSAFQCPHCGGPIEVIH